MNVDNTVLLPEVMSFIKEHEESDIAQLILKGSPFKNTSIQSIAQQIKGLQVAKAKFPTLYKNPYIIYPPKINLEQSSSELTANFKAKFISNSETILDLTGGMGIDTLAFSKISNEVSYTEIDKKTCAFAKHNFNASNKSIIVKNVNGIAYLKGNKQLFDWIYVDPARRDKHNTKVFKFEDCQPNIIQNLDIFRLNSNKLMLKASPLLDINYITYHLPDVKSIHVVSVKNEVKEILIIIDFKSKNANTFIETVNLDTRQDVQIFNVTDKLVEQDFSLPMKYIYEPNASIMKVGFFGKICKDFNLKALHANSHLFTSDENITFPGRKFKVAKIIKPKQSELNKYIKGKKANISTRNYPLKPQQIKKKYGLNDGGSLFVFFTTNINNEKIVLICNKVIN